MERDWANLAAFESLCDGVYGGLHIAPFGPLKPAQEAVVIGMGKYDFKKVAANHCTGIPAVKKMIWGTRLSKEQAGSAPRVT